MMEPVIEFKDFTFKYRSQAEPTLKNINLSIYPGEKVLIIGPSGSGKSTLTHCINGLAPFFYHGEITGSLKIKGVDTKHSSIFGLSKLEGTVLQDPDSQFIGLTVGEDIAFKLENNRINQAEMQKAVQRASKIVDLENHLEVSPHKLSGGQKQRVTLAGVMVDNVDILIFDEPLANLDPATGKSAIELIDEIKNTTDKTIVIIEHRLEDVLHRHVDRIILVNDGQILADLSANELLSSTLLQDNGIREPLYITALKYAGVKIEPALKPESIDTLHLPLFADKLTKWFEATNDEEPASEKPTVLELRNVSFKYPTGKEILRNVSFQINKGDMVSIVGRNGAGKSTISKLICGFYKPSSGSILFNGRDMASDTIKERAEKIGLIMQNPNQMLSKTMIYEEVALGLKTRGLPEEEIKDRVYETLKICGLYEFRNWPISALSFGQKKRVTIAAILALNPEVIILDEPTAGQDFKHYNDIMEFLVQLNQKGVTIIMITHDMHLMQEYTNRAIAISYGTKIAEDTAAAIITDSEIIKAANLKETSLYELAQKAGLNNPKAFVTKFIHYDRRMRRR